MATKIPMASKEKLREISFDFNKQIEFYCRIALLALKTTKILKPEIKQKTNKQDTNFSLNTYLCLPIFTKSNRGKVNPKVGFVNLFAVFLAEH